MSDEHTTGDRDAADGSQAPCKTGDTQTGLTKRKHSFLKKNNQSPQETSGAVLKPCNENPKVETSMIRNFGSRLSKRFSFKEKIPIKSPTNKQNVNEFKALEEDQCDTNDPQVTDSTTEKSPLSVMEINELITSKKLLEAQENINKLEEELLNETPPEYHETHCHEFTKRVRDLGHLCDALAKQMKSIVFDSLTATEENGHCLSSALKVIELEEIADRKWLERTNQAEDQSFRRPRKLRDMWQNTIMESVRKTINDVPLAKKEENKSWIALHLAHLQMTLLKDLKIIKNFVQKSYSEEDKICNRYVKCYHEKISSHLQELAQGDLELNDLNSFLKWVIHTYQSEDVMGHPDLSPEVNVQELSPLVDEETVKDVKDRYLKALQLTVKELLIRTLEGEEKAWSEDEEAEELMGYYHSDITHHISKMIHEYVKESGNISKELENNTLLICLDELINLVQSYQQKLQAFTKEVRANTLSVVISSINSCMELREHVENLRQGHTVQDDKTEKALDNAVQDFNTFLLKQVLIQVKPYFKKLMTKRWLSNGEDFESIIRITEDYCQKFKKIKPTNCQVLADDIHYQFVKLYITQIMKQCIRCKQSSKREAAATKIKDELGTINTIFEELGSTASWLLTATKHLAGFIGDSKSELEGHLNKLYEEYRDISEEHVSALLYFRGISRGRRKNRLINQLKNNKSDEPATKPLFRDISVPVTD
ncbi:exocyst complex component 3-like isoform X2 [Callorhinchus milii]|uniref:exocyst complex component 3-like isoform X2 n=1 Tax=Callorhinchus milii TaxID=7868 RepID=UPI001C3F984A|nr:exocyst complex component 3-like isoform X2 [Callorhinchus milii]